MFKFTYKWNSIGNTFIYLNSLVFSQLYSIIFFVIREFSYMVGLTSKYLEQVVQKSVGYEFVLHSFNIFVSGNELDWMVEKRIHYQLVFINCYYNFLEISTLHITILHDFEGFHPAGLFHPAHFSGCPHCMFIPPYI